jgi:hypothetical protein
LDAGDADETTLPCVDSHAVTLSTALDGSTAVVSTLRSPMQAPFWADHIEKSPGRIEHGPAFCDVFVNQPLNLFLKKISEKLLSVRLATHVEQCIGRVENIILCADATAKNLS